MPVPMIRGRSSSRVRRSREYNLPFAVDNRLALDAAVASSVTTSIDGVTQWSDLGPTGNVFANDHAAGSQPGYSGGLVTFDGGDHLHRPGGLFPATSDWAFVARHRFDSISSGNNSLIAQYETPTAPSRFFIGISSGGLYYVFWQNVVTLNGPAPSVGVPTTLAVWRTGSSLRLRINGGGTYTASAGTGSIYQVGNVIGAYSFTTGNYDDASNMVSHMTGSIQRLGIWHGTFSSSDIAEIENWASNGG